jgi:glutamyl-tRNA synthetase
MGPVQSSAGRHQTIRTRFAPSPTGYLHIGGVRTALYSWLFARHHGGEFLLRIEDTDRERSTAEAIDAILGGMQWLGLDADAAPIYQTQRFDAYRTVLERMLEEGLAYRCYCSREEIEQMREAARARGEKPRYDGRCRNRSEPVAGVAPVVRFRSPTEGIVELEDMVKGRIEFDNAELDDLIIARSDGTPTYNFTVVVDDAQMQITHVIRGDDHVNNTPRQINLFRALGYEVPRYAHLPMIHGSDGAKLSKRHGAVSVLEFREMGILPDALLNYLLRLGWSLGDQEIFSRSDMIRLFDIANVSRSAANFDPAKLRWVNQQHIIDADTGALAALLESELERRSVDVAAGPPADAVVEALRERAQTIVEMADKALCYFADFDEFDPKSAKTHLRPVALPLLAELRRALAETDVWTIERTQTVVESVAEMHDVKLGKLAQPLRVALTGQAASPGIGVTLALVGRERALQRIDRAIEYIGQRAGA